MLIGESESKENAAWAPRWEPVRERELRLRREAKQIVTVEECGRIIGKIVSPVEQEIFGPWRGSVYLLRD